MHYVYRFMDNLNSIIYIGYTECLSSRIDRQHFQKQGHLGDLAYAKVKTIEYLAFEEQEDALFNEKYYILKFNPAYNVTRLSAEGTGHKISVEWKFYCDINNGHIINKTKSKDINKTVRTPISNAIDTKLLERLKDYSKDSMIPMSKILDKAIEQYLNELNK